MKIAENIMAFNSHSDDLEFMMSGTLAKKARQGINVDQILMTDSNGQNCAEKRKLEALAGMAILGLGKVFFVGNDNGFKDGALRYYKTEKLVKAALPIFEKAEEEGHPYTEIFVTDEGGVTGHWDHMKVNRVAKQLAKLLSSIAWISEVSMSPLEKEAWDSDYAPLGGYFRRIKYVNVDKHLAEDISETIALKVDSIRAHKTQLANGGQMHIDRIGKLPKVEYYKRIERTVFQYL